MPSFAKKNMRYLILFSTFLISINLTIAQYNSPNNSLNWNLDSLVKYSSGAIIKNATNYQVLQDVLISATDTISINQNERIEFAFDIELEIQGSLIINPTDSVVITAIDSTQLYKPLRFDGSNSSYFNKCIIEYGGGFNVLNSNFTIENSEFRYNADGSSGAIDLFRSNLIIRNNYIHDNVGPAISSGANIASAPQIISNRIVNNVSGGSNKSQINFGTSGNDTIKILKNTIIGSHTNAGGIAVLAIGSFQAQIDSNLINNNRYGIAILSSPSHTIISRNTITDNDIQNNPNLGGSGINFNGNSNNKAIISENTISGNLWGITIQGTAKPNIGNLRSSDYNIGKNYFGSNGNGGNLYNIYNNTPDSIFAQNNRWEAANLTALENTISHKVDNSSLGYVLYTPVFQLITALPSLSKAADNFIIYPNPSSGLVNLAVPEFVNAFTLYIRDISGRIIHQKMLQNEKRNTVNIDGLPGVYFVELIFGQERRIQKVVIQ